MEKLPLRETVTEILKARGQSKYSLAKRMGVSPQSFDNTLKGNVTITTFLRIATGLEMSPSVLMSEVMSRVKL